MGRKVAFWLAITFMAVWTLLNGRTLLIALGVFVPPGRPDPLGATFTAGAIVFILAYWFFPFAAAAVVAALARPHRPAHSRPPE